MLLQVRVPFSGVLDSSAMVDGTDGHTATTFPNHSRIRQHVQPFKTESTNPLPLPPPLDKVWLNVVKIIDTFHIGNHISAECKAKYSPDKIKAENPDFNTQAGEQTFVWAGRYRHILCSMCKTYHLFYLHRMVLRRNSYTEKCYMNGKKPILPKSSLHSFVPHSQPEISTEV